MPTQGDVAAVLADLRPGGGRGRQAALHEHFQARIRLSALVLGHLADAAGRATAGGAGGPRRAAPPSCSPAVEGVMQRVRKRKRPFGPEGVAWVERVHAEHLRLRWLAGVEAPDPEELLAAVAARRSPPSRRWGIPSRSPARRPGSARCCGPPDDPDEARP